MLHFPERASRLSFKTGSRSSNGCHESAIYLLINLLKGALTWFLVGSPPQDRCAMAETPAGEMIIGHFDYVFRLHWLPFGRPLCRPSAGPPGAFPVKLLSFFMASSLSVRAGLSLALMPEENPT